MNSAERLNWQLPRPIPTRSAMDRIVLVDRSDRVIGVGDKLDVHRVGQLHRGFSIVITDSGGRILLQQRAARKYHFAGLWSNACCSHPLLGEPIERAAHRRLREELGCRAQLAKLAELRYRAHDEKSGLVEHEYLHVFTGQLAPGEHLAPNPEEVGACRWISHESLLRAMRMRPQIFTPWFRLLCSRYSNAWNDAQTKHRDTRQFLSAR